MLGPTCASSQATNGAAARQVVATCSSAASRPMPSSPGSRRPAISALWRSSPIPRVIARVAARGRVQRLPRDLEPGGLGRRRRAATSAAPVVVGGHRRASGRAGRGRARSSRCRRTGRGPRAPRRGRRGARQHAVGARLVRGLVGREAEVALLAEDARLAAELRPQRLEQRVEAAADLRLVAVRAWR